MKPLNLIFAGTPDFAATVLASLIDSPHNVIAAYSQPDRPAGRGRKLTASPVKQLATANNIPVYQPLNFKDPADIDALAALQPDLMVVVAYGLLLPQAVLDIPHLGCINVHASLLPRWRGAAPIHRAICAGDQETGVTIMQMDAGLDTGDMLLKVATPIDPNETAGALHDRLATLGARACVASLEQLANQTLTPQVQDDSQANYAHKLAKSDGLIDWQQSATSIHNKIRGLHPWPGSYAVLNEQTIRLHGSRLGAHNVPENAQPGEILTADANALSVATKEGVLALTHLQLPGGKNLSVRDILNGRQEQFKPGTVFG